MTFQIGIVGSDGVVIASDQKYRDEGWQTWKSQKIMIDDDKKIAFCTAGTDLPSYVARDAYTSEDPLRFFLSESKTSILGYLKTERPAENHGSILWAGLASDGKVHLWSLDIKGRDYQIEMLQQVYDRRYIGYPSPADWIVEAYWPERPTKEMPIADLQFFAAHAVLMSGKMNGRAVEGLEIAMCRSEKFEWVSHYDIAEMTRLSDELYSDIAKRLFARRTSLGRG